MSQFLASFIALHCILKLIIQDYAHNAYHWKARVTFCFLVAKTFSYHIPLGSAKTPLIILFTKNVYLLYSECVLLHFLTISISTLWLWMPTKSKWKADFQVVKNAEISWMIINYGRIKSIFLDLIDMYGIVCKNTNKNFLLLCIVSFVIE